MRSDVVARLPSQIRLHRDEVWISKEPEPPSQQQRLRL